jgi:thioredoxin 1
MPSRDKIECKLNKIMEITSQNFNELIAQGKPVMVDFWATWCGPCKKIAPLVEELATEYEGKAIIGKVNVEDEDDLVAQFGVRNIPTILFFKDGEVVDKVVGAVPKSELESKLKALL